MIGGYKSVKYLPGPVELPGDSLSPTSTIGLHPAIRRVSLQRKRGRADSALRDSVKEIFLQMKPKLENSRSGFQTPMRTPERNWERPSVRNLCQRK